ncbi:MAG: E3 binding domain-containing protein, partial [Solirubrobacterales bacterium]|nr:E3 binding domain-containing protein [Solirubrobacterales bacterium]
MTVEARTVQVVMPAMGDSVTEGTILEWRKREGDSVAAEETIVEISTDKVDAEVPAPVGGTIAKLHAAEGDTVAVGSLLAEISTNGADAQDDVPPTPVSGESPPTSVQEAVASAATEAEGLAAADSAAGETIEIVTPAGGESVTEGTILAWTVKPGDAVKQGDTVVEISTDKVDMELPAPASGTITELVVEEGETVSVGQVIARMTAGAATASASAVAPERSASGMGDETTGAAPEVPGETAPAAPAPTDGSHASPVARRMAQSQGVDLGTVRGTARGGRITKADVLAAAGNGAAAQ